MKFKRISVEKAKTLIEREPSLTIADIRDRESFERSNIPSSVHLTNHSVNSFLQTASKENPLLIYCYHGNSSQQAAAYFVGEGFKDVYSMDGGYTEYLKSELG